MYNTMERQQLQISNMPDWPCSSIPGHSQLHIYVQYVTIIMYVCINDMLTTQAEHPCVQRSFQLTKYTYINNPMKRQSQVPYYGTNKRQIVK